MTRYIIQTTQFTEMGASFSRIKIRSLCIFIFVNAVDRARGHSCTSSSGNVQHHDGHLTVLDGTASIPEEEYRDCDGITGVTFNTDGALKVIGGYAFSGADGFAEVTIPASVTSIESYAFLSCDELARVVFDTTDGPSLLESIGQVSNPPPFLFFSLHLEISLFA